MSSRRPRALPIAVAQTQYHPVARSSSYFLRPTYQGPIANALGYANRRAVPDISAIANPITGVWVYCGAGCGSPGWLILGGTSVASPLAAGLTNAAGTFRASTQAELGYIYMIGTTAFSDVSRGVCGPYAGYFAMAGTAQVKAAAYDRCTGVGAPRGARHLDRGFWEAKNHRIGSTNSRLGRCTTTPLFLSGQG